jgi:hypothetical protein
MYRLVGWLTCSHLTAARGKKKILCGNIDLYGRKTAGTQASR